MPSTAIRRFHYDPEGRRLLVTFVSGQTYAYFDVPPEVDEAFRAAFSKGRFFQDRIRDRFDYARVTGEDGPVRTGRRSTAGPPPPSPATGR